jgi:histidyl-tRNA synthetase
MVRTLPGFREFYPEDCSIRNFLFHTFRRVVWRFGFEEFDGPTLESLELFTEKSGEEIVSQLFHFTDRGGRAVALRPELTPTLARMVSARAATLRRPIRWCNIGEHFRYERPQKGRLRSFYQMNVDLLGEPGVRADGEIMAVLVAILQEFQLTADDFLLHISDRQLWIIFLKRFPLEKSQVINVLGIIDRLEREDGEKSQKMIMEISPIHGDCIMSGIDQLRRCKTLDQLREFFSEPAAEERLREWEELLQLLHDLQLDQFICIDLSIVRGLAYYTGFVFEVYERQGKSRALAGGGRYDHLLGKLCNTPMAACGFAMGDVTLENLLRSRGLLPTAQRNVQIFAIFSRETEAEALALCQELRHHNVSVIYNLGNALSFSKQLQNSSKSGTHFALFIGTNEVKLGRYVLKDLCTGNEESLPREELLGRFFHK